jgi:hypothetical protein
MKKTIVALLVGASLVSGGVANASVKATFTPAKNIPQQGAVVTFKLSGLPKTHGIYIQECMAPAKGAKAPTVCDSNQSAQAWASLLKSDIAQGATNAAGAVTLKPEPYFSKGDCVHTKCVFFISSDHNMPTDTSVNAIYPFTFAAK